LLQLQTNAKIDCSSCCLAKPTPNCPPANFSNPGYLCRMLGIIYVAYWAHCSKLTKENSQALADRSFPAPSSSGDTAGFFPLFRLLEMSQ